MRPIFFAAVKETVSDRCLPQYRDLSQKQGSFPAAWVRQCTDAARRNLQLGSWIRKMSPVRKLLFQEAHSVFNAAIILLLSRLVLTNPDIHNSFASHFAFALEVFSHDDSLGYNFGFDCLEVLHDLHSLVDKLEKHLLASEGMSREALRLRNIAQIATDESLGYSAQFCSESAFGPESRPANGQTPAQTPAIAEEGILYQELQGWLERDEGCLSLYSEFGI